MKKILMVLSLQSLLATAHSSENLKWVKSPFWKAPQSLEFHRRIKIVDKELINNCTNYNRFVEAYKNSEVTSSLARTVDDYRKEGLTMQKSFKGRFEVLDVPFGRILENEYSAENDSSNEILPMYNQSKSITSINLTNIKEFEFVAMEDSMVGFSRRLGLINSTAILTTNRSGKLIIEVNGSDLACDLLTKKVVLKAGIQSFVRITEEASQEMNKFYNSKLAPQLVDVLAKADSIQVKAARLGFRIGKLLEEKNDGKLDNLQIEGQMGNLMNLLFVPKTLSPSSLLLTQENNRKAIDFLSSVNGATATITLGM